MGFSADLLPFQHQTLAYALKMSGRYTENGGGFILAHHRLVGKPFMDKSIFLGFLNFLILSCEILFKTAESALHLLYLLREIGLRGEHNVIVHIEWV